VTEYTNAPTWAQEATEVVLGAQHSSNTLPNQLEHAGVGKQGMYSCETNILLL
jgi:hypothetical protein